MVKLFKQAAAVEFSAPTPQSVLLVGPQRLEFPPLATVHLPYALVKLRLQIPAYTVFAAAPQSVAILEPHLLFPPAALHKL